MGFVFTTTFNYYLEDLNLKIRNRIFQPGEQKNEGKNYQRMTFHGVFPDMKDRTRKKRASNHKIQN